MTHRPMAVDSEPWLEVYRWMLWSRLFEAECGRRNPRWFPAEGEEATIVGSFFDLRLDDVAAPHYRGPFVVYAMRGAEPWRLAAQVLGKAAGYSKGRSVPFNGPLGTGIVPWVAGDLGTTLGVATGAGLAFEYDGSDRVCVVSFGDGTANRGDFHETINLAACWSLPVIYVCQHNGWAISEPADSYLKATVSARAAGYGIPGESVDGNDVLAVRAAVGQAVARARNGGGPSLVEACTYRLQGHWAADRASYRVAEAVEAWRERDPLPRLKRVLDERGLADASALERIESELGAEVAEAFARAEASPDPGPADLGLAST
ncbi:MAG TPA: thiamine pyrophosphate-dependent dehydrogenase E1 component subunit alpha [Chloroflexota bacterium]|nr:thiamine pyrophosphate-dependent dehydrogenase E1 component subunit alpha [Chloroflexota bacterium]